MKRWSSDAPPEMWVLLLALRICGWLLDFWKILGLLNGEETFTYIYIYIFGPVQESEEDQGKDGLKTLRKTSRRWE